MSETPVWTFSYPNGTFEAVELRDGMYVRKFDDSINVYDGHGNYTVYPYSSIKKYHIETVKGSSNGALRRAKRRRVVRDREDQLTAELVELDKTRAEYRAEIDAELRSLNDQWYKRLESHGLYVGLNGVIQASNGGDFVHAEMLIERSREQAEDQAKLWAARIKQAGMQVDEAGQVHPDRSSPIWVNRITREAQSSVARNNLDWYDRLDKAGLYMNDEGEIRRMTGKQVPHECRTQECSDERELGKRGPDPEPSGESVNGGAEVGGRGDVPVAAVVDVDGSEGDAARV